MAFDINFNDARFQEALLKRRASSPTKAINTGFAEHEAWAANQAGLGVQFQNLATKKRMDEHNLMANRARFDLQKRAFNQSIKDRREDLTLGIFTGLGTTLLAGYQARQRQKRVDSLTASMEAWLKENTKKKDKK